LAVCDWKSFLFSIEREGIYSKGLERDKYKGIRRSKKTQKGFSNPFLRISISKIMWMNNIWLYFGSDLAAWPSGKAGDSEVYQKQVERVKPH
jgi:hypothetical protein